MCFAIDIPSLKITPESAACPFTCRNVSCGSDTARLDITMSVVSKDQEDELSGYMSLL